MVHKEMGKGSTSDSELRNGLKKFGLSPAQVGPLSLYQKRVARLKAAGRRGVPKYGIYNTMDTAPGAHWFCTYDTYKYDPLGDDTSNTQDQPSNTNDCGQRCIAYLLMCKQHGGAIRGY